MILPVVSSKKRCISAFEYKGRLVALEGLKRPLLAKRSTVIGDIPRSFAVSVLEYAKRLSIVLR